MYPDLQEVHPNIEASYPHVPQFGEHGLALT
jgi:hypothetical protein